MTVSSINANASSALAATLARSADLAAAANAASSTAKGDAASTAKTSQTNDPKAVKKAASQFEAIILRQLLSPTIDPLMSGGMGGDGDSGGGVYGYMLTDALSDNLAKGGGLGLARMLQKQLSPPVHPAAAAAQNAGPAAPSATSSLTP